MYNNDVYFMRYKMMYKEALKGNKVIFKKWSDTEGIRRTLRYNKVRGIIISGSDYFVKGERGGRDDRATIDECILRSKIPILAICYGFQYMVHKFGRDSFVKSGRRGYMEYTSSFQITSPFYMPKSKYYFFHTDYIVKVPKDYQVIKRIKNKIMIAYNAKKNILGVQFHPERYKRSRGVFFKLWINKCVRSLR